MGSTLALITPVVPAGSKEELNRARHLRFGLGA